MDINKRDEDGATLLELALFSGRSLPIVKSLVQLGANANVKSRNESGTIHAPGVGGNKQVC